MTDAVKIIVFGMENSISIIIWLYYFVVVTHYPSREIMNEDFRFFSADSMVINVHQITKKTLVFSNNNGDNITENYIELKV